MYSDCIVCPSIYNFWLPLWCIQTVLSVLRFRTSGYLFGIFRLYCLSFYLQLLIYPFGVFRLYCLSLDLQLLVTPFVYSDYCLLQFTTSDYPFGVFRLYCLSFYLQLLVTPLVYSDYCPSFNLQLLVTPLVYSDCIVCPLIYNFWLPLWCIQTVLSVLRFTTSGYPFGVFRLYCLSFYLQLLITPLVYSDSIVCP